MTKVTVEGKEKEVQEQIHHWGRRKLVVDVVFVRYNSNSVLCSIGANREQLIDIPLSRFPEPILKVLDDKVSFVVMTDYDDCEIDDHGSNLFVEDAVWFNLLYKPHWSEWKCSTEN